MRIALLIAALLMLVVAADIQVHAQTISNQPVFLCDSTGTCIPFTGVTNNGIHPLPVYIVTTVTPTPTATHTPTPTPT